MIRIDRLRLRAGNFELDDVTLHVRPGEYFVLMGPTGSGKSLTIKAVSGLLRPSAGRIVIDGLDVTRLEPRDRAVGYMPQDCGLFPHLSVARNIAYSLGVVGASLASAIRVLSPLIDMLGIGHLLARKPRNLSGGEMQKVALARALAARPKVLLLDEPVSALDEPTRRGVCSDLRAVQQRLGISTIHVCHSLEEARSVADRVGVMQQGRILQCGAIQELSAAPASEQVARLMNVQIRK